MIFPGGMNKITSHQLHEKLSDLKLVWRELPIDIYDDKGERKA